MNTALISTGSLLNSLDRRRRKQSAPTDTFTTSRNERLVSGDAGMSPLPVNSAAAAHVPTQFCWAWESNASPRASAVRK